MRWSDGGWQREGTFFPHDCMPSGGRMGGWFQRSYGRVLEVVFFTHTSPVSLRATAATAKYGAHNSAVECHLHTVEVVGSNPAVPTNPFNNLAGMRSAFAAFCGKSSDDVFSPPFVSIVYTDPTISCTLSGAPACTRWPSCRAGSAAGAPECPSPTPSSAPGSPSSVASPGSSASGYPRTSARGLRTRLR